MLHTISFLNSFYFCSAFNIHLFVSLLSNSSLSLVRLGDDFVLPLSQQQEEEQQEQQQPPPKSIRRGCTKSMKFDIL